MRVITETKNCDILVFWVIMCKTIIMLYSASDTMR